MNEIAAGAIIIGIINAIKTQYPEIEGLLALAIAIGLGVLFGILQWFGVTTIEVGVAVALASSGIYTVAKRAGGQ